MQKPWSVTVARYERILAEGLYYAPSIEACKAKLRKELERIEKPYTVSIEAAYSADKRCYEETYL